MKRVAIIILSLLLLFTASYADTSKIDVKIGVLAKRGAQKALEKWGATTHYLNEYYPHYNVTIVPMGFDEIPMLVSNALVDFVIVNSGIYVDLEVKYGVNRIATLKNHLKSESDVTKFGSVIFVKKDSPIHSLHDMIDARVAAVHPTSFGGWIMAKRELNDVNIDSNAFKTLEYLYTHDKVVLGVLSGEFEVGIVRTDTLERMGSEGKINMAKLRVINPKEHRDFPFLVSSRLYPEWPIAKLHHTQPKIAKDVVVALMKMNSTSKAAQASK
ncbi:MAG: phosphate/phosphite/phosphonate ABC transporter substrate-binding protein, partial [Campylobacterota bacterium]|nr:phosphate/phosphite/phosphonate ABC transporter substrate-binding protein [Campylobacterota bacterium]